MKSLALAVLMLFPVFTMAASDVTCHKDDCLHSGWIAVNRQTGYWVDNICNQDDCTKNGWTSSANDGARSETVCLEDSCFTKGYSETVVTSGSRRIDTVCNVAPENGSTVKPGDKTSDKQTDKQKVRLPGTGEDAGAGDCWKYGWQSRSGGAFQTAACRNQDCSQLGWIVDTPGSRQVTAVCKSGGCFVKGWTLYP